MRSNRQNNGLTAIPGGYHAGADNRKGNTLSSSFTDSVENVESFSEVFQRIVGGIKGLYIALKFQFHSRTFGIFKSVNSTWVKGLVIICCAYFFLFKNKDGEGLLSPPAFLVSEGGQARDSYDLASAVSFGAENGNPFAPASPKDLREQQVKNYVKRFSTVAVTEMDKYDIPASILMAQGIIESRCGESRLATAVNNHFGIKCFSKKCARGHCTNFEDDHHKDFFRSYKSAWESWRDHSKLLTGGRYKSLHEHGKDYRAWAVGLKEIGYATDKNYDKKLISIIEQYDLQSLDDL